MQRRLMAGFTLIELLVVLIILGVVISMAVTLVRPMSDARRAQVTAQQCQRVLQAAEQEALLTPAVLGLEITPQGLQFYRYVIDHNHLRWQPLHPDHLSQPRLFADQGLQVTRSPRTPRKLVISASGEVTPFRLTISNAHHTLGYRVSVNAVGAITISPLSEHAP